MSKSKKRIRAVVIGGSNTVMGADGRMAGYLGETVARCKKKGRKLQISDNLSVGGTTIFNGLYLLKNSRKLKKADLLIIEYALNDTSGHERDRKLLQHWSRAYEGVIRYAREQNPRLDIISIIFESRTPREARRLSFIHAAIHRISAIYKTRVVDMARRLVDTVGADKVDSDTYYHDAHHISPVVVKTVAKILAKDIFRPGSKKRRKRELPEPIDTFNFAHAKTLSSDALTYAVQHRYRNSRFDVRAAELANQRLSFTLSGGKLLGLGYVCEATTGPAFVRCGDLLYQVNLMKPGVASGNFTFLSAFSGCDFLYPPDVNRPDETRSYTLSPIADGAVAKAVTPPAMMLHSANPAPTLALMGLLYTGEMSDLRLEDVQVTAAPPALAGQQARASAAP